MDNLKTKTLSHNVMSALTVATFNVPMTDNDSHDETVGQIITIAAMEGIEVDSVKVYSRNGFITTFIQLRSVYATDTGELQ